MLKSSRGLNSMISFIENNEIVGDAAKEQVLFHPTTTIYDTKRLIGRRFKDSIVQSDMKRWKFQVIEGPDGFPKIVIPNLFPDGLTPEVTSAKILINLKSIAEDFLGFTVKDAVITVPAYFNDSQRQSTVNSGKLAGLNVLKILNEPTAVAIALASGLNPPPNVLFMRITLAGAHLMNHFSKFSAAISMFLAGGDTHLGGQGFGNNMVDCFADIFKKERGIDIRDNHRSYQLLKL